MGTRFCLGWWKCFKIDNGEGCTILWIYLKTTEIVQFKEWILYYVNSISIFSTLGMWIWKILLKSVKFPILINTLWLCKRMPLLLGKVY